MKTRNSLFRLTGELFSRINCGNYGRVVFPAVLLLLVSACSVPSVPDRRTFSRKLPVEYSTGIPIDDAKSMYWECSFPSPNLKGDVLRLYQENLALEAARARVQQAAAAHGLAASERMPSVDVTSGFERSRKKDGITPDYTTESVYSLGAVFRWEADIWGRLQARQEAAALMVKEKQLLSEQAALELQTVLVEKWIAYQTACRLTQILRAQQQVNTQILELTELRLAHGEGSALAVLQQKGQLAGIDRQLPRIHFEKEKAAASYAVLLGQFPGKGIGPREEEWPLLHPLENVISPYQLLQMRKDLQAAFHALLAADQEVAAAIADRLPRLSIDLAYSLKGNSLNNIGDQTGMSFLAGILAPVFDAGRLQIQVDQRKAHVRELLALLEQMLLTAVKELEEQLIREEALFAEYALLKREITLAEETVDKARLNYVNGQETFLSVLIGITRLQKLQQNEVLLKQEMYVNRCHLLKNLGAKWSDHEKT